MFKIILFSLIIIISFSTVFAQDADNNVSKAKRFIGLLAKKDFATAETYFSNELTFCDGQNFRKIWYS